MTYTQHFDCEINYTNSRQNILFFFLNDPPTPEIYPLPLHDPLPIPARWPRATATITSSVRASSPPRAKARDRKSTRLNSSHSQISYAVFCLKKKKLNSPPYTTHRHTPSHQFTKHQVHLQRHATHLVS